MVRARFLDAPVRAAPRGFAENTMLHAGFQAKCLASSLQRKPCSVEFRELESTKNRATLLRYVLGPGQVRAIFAGKTVLRARLLSSRRCWGPRSSAAIFPRKPRLVSELNAWVRAGPRQVCRENPAPLCVVVLCRDSTRSALWKFAEFAICLNPLHAPRCGGKQTKKHGCSHDRFAKRMFMQQMASDIFGRILWGMEACRKARTACALSWMTPSETLLRLCLGGFGDMKWAWGGGWRLPAFLCQTTSSPGFYSISRAHFRDRKTLQKRVHHKLHVAEEMVAPRPDCAIPKMSSKVVRQHQNAGPKMRPFSEPSGNMPILRGTKNGFESGPIFEAASHSFFVFSTPKK